MNDRKVRRIKRVLTPRQQASLRRNRRLIAAELPDLTARDQMRKEARDEPTFSGELRRAIHASRLTLSEIATQAGIPPLMLDEFLTGERTLRSDVLDRLTRSLGLVLTPQR
jgi:hypothetical protein